MKIPIRRESEINGPEDCNLRIDDAGRLVAKDGTEAEFEFPAGSPVVVLPYDQWKRVQTGAWVARNWSA